MPRTLRFDELADAFPGPSSGSTRHGDRLGPSSAAYTRDPCEALRHLSTPERLPPPSDSNTSFFHAAAQHYIASNASRTRESDAEPTPDAPASEIIDERFLSPRSAEAISTTVRGYTIHLSSLGQRYARAFPVKVGIEANEYRESYTNGIFRVEAMKCDRVLAVVNSRLNDDETMELDERLLATDPARCESRDLWQEAEGPHRSRSLTQDRVGDEAEQEEERSEPRAPNQSTTQDPNMPPLPRHDMLQHHPFAASAGSSPSFGGAGERSASPAIPTRRSGPPTLGRPLPTISTNRLARWIMASRSDALDEVQDRQQRTWSVEETAISTSTTRRDDPSALDVRGSPARGRAVARQAIGR